MALKDPKEYLELVRVVKHSPGSYVSASYDEEGDVLYVQFKDPGRATDSELTDEDIEASSGMMVTRSLASPSFAPASVRAGFPRLISQLPVPDGKASHDGTKVAELATRFLANQSEPVSNATS